MKYIFSLSILILVIIISCKSAANEDVFNNFENKKTSLTKKQLLNHLYIRIKNYNLKNNSKALVHLKKAIYLKTGKPFYYYGNVSMNLKNYKVAIAAYSQSYFKKFRTYNSIFNIACAYSLLKKARSCYISLLNNYNLGDKNIKRIYLDKDLDFFRKSIYFPIFKKSLLLR